MESSLSSASEMRLLMVVEQSSLTGSGEDVLLSIIFCRLSLAFGKGYGPSIFVRCCFPLLTWVRCNSGCRHDARIKKQRTSMIAFFREERTRSSSPLLIVAFPGGKRVATHTDPALVRQVFQEPTLDRGTQALPSVKINTFSYRLTIRISRKSSDQIPQTCNFHSGSSYSQPRNPRSTHTQSSSM